MFQLETRSLSCLMAYPTKGYRTTEARQLSNVLPRNSGSDQPRAAVEVIPPDRTRTRSRYNTGFPTGMYQTPPPSVSNGGRTITIPAEVRNQIADNLPDWRARDRLRSGNNMVIDLKSSEWREVQRGNRRVIIRAILRGLKFLTKDIRFQIALQLLEWLLQYHPWPQEQPVPRPGDYVPPPGWHLWSYHPSVGAVPGQNWINTVRLLTPINQVTPGNNGVSNQFWPPISWGWATAPHEVSLLTGTAANEGFNPDHHVAAFWQKQSSNRKLNLWAYYRLSGTAPFSWQRAISLELPLDWRVPRPSGSARPGERPANRPGIGQTESHTGGYAAPSPVPVAKPRPDGDGWYPGDGSTTNAFPGPPPPRTKERKLASGTIGRFLWNALNPITEFFDFIDVLFWALPQKIRARAWYLNGRRQLNPYQKAELLYKHWHEVDVQKAVQNYIYAQAQDYFYGRLGQLVGKSTQVIAPHRPIGIGAGPWSKGIELLPN